MKLKSFEWLLIIYQLIIIVIAAAYSNNITKIDYRYLIAAHAICILFIIFFMSRVTNAFIKNLYPFLILPFFYNEIGLIHHILYKIPQDEIFITIDKLIFRENIGLTLCRHFSGRMFSEIMHFFYFSYYFITVLPAIYLFNKSTAALERYMFIILCSFFVFYIIFIFYPVYGPEFYIKYLGKSLNPKTLNGYYFRDLLHFILNKAEIHGAAFPSSHVGIALIVYLLIKSYNKILTALVFICMLGICIATVYTRAHYFIDVIAGLIAGYLFYLFTAFVYDKLISGGKG